MSAQEAVDFTDDFAVEDAPAAAEAGEATRETDPHRVAQRQKQIDFGKNTLGYQRYTEAVPREQRRKTHPRTPDVHQSCSKRAFDGQVRKWRRMLHEWDPEAAAAEAAAAAAAAKNGGAARPAGGLPLKMTPAPAPRPAGKRSYAATLVHSAGPAPRPPPAAAAAAAAAALISPPPCPPDAKQARRRAAVPVTAGGAGVGTVLNLAATWRDMSLTPAMAMAGASTIAAADDVDAWFGAPEVCYDEGEGEGGGAEAMQVEGLVA